MIDIKMYGKVFVKKGLDCLPLANKHKCADSDKSIPM